MLTDPGDLVLDPFAGSCITGQVAERLGRQWVCSELVDTYLEGAKGRFGGSNEEKKLKSTSKETDVYYRIPHPGLLWEGPDQRESAPLQADGGKLRPAHMRKLNMEQDEVTFIEAAE